MKLDVNADLSMGYNSYIEGFNRTSNLLYRGSEYELQKGSHVHIKKYGVIDGFTPNDQWECLTLYPRDVKEHGVFWYDTYALSDLLDFDWDNWESQLSNASEANPA